jgi:hypothetical protein
MFSVAVKSYQEAAAEGYCLSMRGLIIQEENLGLKEPRWKCN